MGLHTETSIYQTAYKLMGLAMGYVRNIPRDSKLLIGGKIRDLSVEVLTLVMRANCAKDKAPALTALVERNEEIQLLIRFCQDSRFISKSQYAKAIELTTSIGKQATAWKKHYAPVT